MSWSISYQTDGAHFVHDTGAVQGGQIGYAENESKEQVAAAKTAIRGLIASGVLGEGGYTVSANGHANLSHQPNPSWVNDTITITISQTSTPTLGAEPAQMEEIQGQEDLVSVQADTILEVPPAA